MLRAELVLLLPAVSRCEHNEADHLFPSPGWQMLIEVDNRCKLRTFNEKWMATEPFWFPWWGVGGICFLDQWWQRFPHEARCPASQMCLPYAQQGALLLSPQKNSREKVQIRSWLHCWSKLECPELCHSEKEWKGHSGADWHNPVILVPRVPSECPSCSTCLRRMTFASMLWGSLWTRQARNPEPRLLKSSD